MSKHFDFQAQRAHNGAWLLCSLIAFASASAQAATPPTLYISGVVGNSTQSLDGFEGTVVFDTSAWLGKPYTLELRPDAASVPRMTESDDELPGAVFNSWAPANVRYRLSIGNGSNFVGTDNQFSEVFTGNDILLPAGLPEDKESSLVVIADGTHTYDFLEMRVSGIDLGCVNGGADGFCNDEGDVYEYGVIGFQFAWDTALHQGFADDSYPDLRNLVFADGFGSAHFIVGRAVASAGSDNGISGVILPFSVTRVSVTPVPEPATWGMLLAGLGLVGFAARRAK